MQNAATISTHAKTKPIAQQNTVTEWYEWHDWKSECKRSERRQNASPAGACAEPSQPSSSGNPSLVVPKLIQKSPRVKSTASCEGTREALIRLNNGRCSVESSPERVTGSMRYQKYHIGMLI
ncbi:unnamed protein product [Gongylonema pulchrum]|uniref:Uncharacterized protein n=1 Tax=Gongylonema pulchrum TaxID=637853 RepID=A0A183DNK2_9BILA|nr:unnamed protein product [Gongylonema pulchrum]